MVLGFGMNRRPGENLSIIPLPDAGVFLEQDFLKELFGRNGKEISRRSCSLDEESFTKTGDSPFRQ